MSRFAIIASVPAELKPSTAGWQRESRRGVDLWHRSHPGGFWVAACAGAGAEAARRAWVEIEQEGAIDGALSLGWAGALRGEFLAGRAYGVSGVIDARTGERFGAAGAAGRVWLVTGPRVADRAEKRRLAAAYDAGLVDMEAAEIARRAAARGIPFYCLKGVSDGWTERLPDFNRFLSADGQLHLGRLLRFALRRPDHWSALIRMAKNSSRAARELRKPFWDILECWEQSGAERNHRSK